MRLCQQKSFLSEPIYLVRHHNTLNTLTIDCLDALRQHSSHQFNNRGSNTLWTFFSNDADLALSLPISPNLSTLSTITSLPSFNPSSLQIAINFSS